MEKKMRVLILEDMEEDAGLIDRALKKEKIQFTRIRVDTRQHFAEAFDSFSPDIILSDHSLPQFNSIEALEILSRSASSRASRGTLIFNPSGWIAVHKTPKPGYHPQ